MKPEKFCIFSNGIDGCKFANNCPLKSGPLTLNLALDLRSFSKIIKLLAGGTPYELTIHMFNANDLSKEIACVRAQLVFAK